MLIDLAGNNFSIECNQCKHKFNVNIKKELHFLEEFGEYENISAVCPLCGMTEIFNMNLQEDEEIDENELPEIEIKQRSLVKKLAQKMEKKGGHKI